MACEYQMTIKPRLSILTLGVADLPRARAFYAALGWRESSFSMDRVAFYNLETGIVFVLVTREALATDAAMSPAGSGFRGFAMSYNAESPAAVDAVIAEALAAGGTLVRAAETASWGGYSGYFADPDGNLWEVGFNHVFPIDAQGRITYPPPATA